MSEVTTTPSVETAAPAPKVAAPKKSVKKVAPKKTATAKAKTATPTKKGATKKASNPAPVEKKTPTKKTAPAAKAPAEPKAKKDGLRKPQERILKALAKKDGLTRKEISEKAPADLAMLNSYIGSHNPDIRAANDAKNFPCLLTLGYVKAQQHEGEPVTYVITAAGRKAAEKIAG